MNADPKRKEAVYWLTSLLYSTLGTCNRLRTCTLIVDKDGQIRGFGTNDSVAGTPSCDEAGHLLIGGHCLRTNHGEENAIISTSREYLKGATAYIIATPCINCVKKLLQAGVARIEFVGSYSNALGKEHIEELCRQKGVPIAAQDMDWEKLFQEAFDLLSQPCGAFHKLGFHLKVAKEELHK